MKKSFSIVLIMVMIFVFIAACQPASATDVISDSQSGTETVASTESETPEEDAATVTAMPTLSENILTGEVSEYIDGVDYFPHKAEVLYASGFSVEYKNNYKVVTVENPWMFAEETFQYILVQKGTPKPEGYEDALFIQVPVASMVSLSTSYLPFLDEYGLLDRLVGVDNADYVSNKTVLKMANDGNLAIVGSGPGVDIETLLDLMPEMIMASGSGSPDWDTHPILLEAGLPTIINGDYMETTPLARAEWGKFIALFFNQEEIANTLFSNTVAKYEEIKALAADVENKPVVFLNTAWEGTWYVPGGKSYTANFIADAGADYLWKEDETTGTLFLSYEEVFDKAGTAGEIWLNPGAYSFTPEDVILLDERYGEFLAYQTGMMYNNNAILSDNGANDFYESGAAHPELILSDMVAIFHPELMPDYELTYYRQVK